MPYVDVCGRALEYEIIHAADAAAPMVVFLHEGLGSVALWREFPRQPEFMHDEALVVLPALLDRLNVHAPVLLGHSDGASIALIHAASAARAVRGAILLAPGTELLKLHDCHHSPHRDQPSAVIAAATRFIDRLRD